jgi:hypothetical protein
VARSIQNHPAAVARACRHPDQAIAIHHAWLESIGYARDRLNIDMRDARIVARRYRLLYDTYLTAHREQEAAK